MSQSKDKHFPLFSTKGFTLTEVIVVMVILGVLATIAVPSFRSFTSSSQAASAANELVTALNLARSEAVTRGARVSVCKSNNPPNCDDSLEWHDGWFVFVGDDPDNVPADALLRVYASQVRNVTMTGGPDMMTYAASGFFVSSDSSGTIVVDAGGKQVNVVASINGRVNAEKQ